MERGSPVRPGEQLGHVLLVDELEGTARSRRARSSPGPRRVVCSGPIKGVHHSYASVDEVVPPMPPLERDEALRRLVTRYVLGHGPTSAQDFAHGSSLTITDTRAALADLGDTLEKVDIDGMPHWHAPRKRPVPTLRPEDEPVTGVGRQGQAGGIPTERADPRDEGHRADGAMRALERLHPAHPHSAAGHLQLVVDADRPLLEGCR